MSKQIYKIKDFSGGLNSLQVASDISNNQVSDAKSIMFHMQGSISPSYIMTDSTNNLLTTGTYRNSTITALEAGYGLGYFASDYGPSTTTKALTTSGTNGFFFTESGTTFELDGQESSAAVDLAALFSVGSELALTGLTGSTDTPYKSAMGIYRVVGHNGNNILLNKRIPLNIETPPQERWAATFTGIPSGDEFILLGNPTDHKVDVFSKLAQSWTNNAIVLNGTTQASISSKIRYYKAGDSIRVCDTTDNSQSKIQWYGHISRSHFNNSDTDSAEPIPILGQFAKDNILTRPSNGDVTYGGTPSYPSAGNGFDIDIVTNSETGIISSGVYEFAQTFIYDGNQESLPSIYTTGTNSGKFTVADTNDLKSLTIDVGLQGDYTERMSGGRIYIREENSVDEWTLLVDIDLEKGCRTNLSNEFTEFTFSSGNQFHCSALRTLELNLLNYEILNGYPSSVFSNYLGESSEKWKDATVANNRVFICNVTMRDEDKGLTKSEASDTNFKDRIMYSMPGRYDTFPYFNFIEAATGDPDHYIAIDSFGDRLLAFKRFSLDIINIASPNDYSWFMEDSRKFMGVEHPELVKKTQDGVIWANKNGLFMYDGSNISNLSENLISDTNWSSHIGLNSGIIYDERESMAFIVKDMDTDGDSYLFDFKKKTFTFIPNFTKVPMTNPVDTDDGQTYLGADTGSQIDIYQLYRAYQKHTPILYKSKEIDFGDPNINKRFYAVYMTFKTSTSLAEKVYYSVDGGATWVLISGGTSLTNTSKWIKGKWALSAPISVSKVMIKVDVPSTSAQLWINDIGLEFRPVHKRMA
tara:strand:- start:4034 stop:6466 length:2433 start_codon:yes stop_codon:yes gene_type:complete